MVTRIVNIEAILSMLTEISAHCSDAHRPGNDVTGFRLLAEHMLPQNSSD